MAARTAAPAVAMTLAAEWGAFERKPHAAHSFEHSRGDQDEQFLGVAGAVALAEQ